MGGSSAHWPPYAFASHNAIPDQTLLNCCVCDNLWHTVLILCADTLPDTLCSQSVQTTVETRLSDHSTLLVIYHPLRLSATAGTASTLLLQQNPDI